jgi:hypothetical protein
MNMMRRWGKEIVSDFEIEDSDWEALKFFVSDAISDVEKWDLLVDKISITQSINTVGLIYIEAYPSERNNNIKGIRSVYRCTECKNLWNSIDLHADNGCPIGTVGLVMAT